MSDTAASKGLASRLGSPEHEKKVRRRYAADRRLQFYGIAAIGLAVLLLGILVASLIQTGYKSFVQTKILLEVPLDAKRIDINNPGKANYRVIVRNAFRALFPDVKGRRNLRNLDKILSSEARFIVRDYVVANPDEIGKTIKIALPLSDPFDQLYKNVIPSQVPALTRRETELFNSLVKRNVVSDQDGRTVVRIDAYIDPKDVPGDELASGDYSAIMKEGFRTYFPQVGARGYEAILAPDAENAIKAYVEANPGSIGKTVQINLPVSEHYDTLFKGKVPMETNPRFASSDQVRQYESLVQRGLLSTPFNWELFFNSDSRFPEQAGLAGAIVGSFYLLLVWFPDQLSGRDRGGHLS